MVRVCSTNGEKRNVYIGFWCERKKELNDWNIETQVAA
jgi:hypothetical protein